MVAAYSNPKADLRGKAVEAKVTAFTFQLSRHRQGYRYSPRLEEPSAGSYLRLPLRKTWPLEALVQNHDHSIAQYRLPKQDQAHLNDFNDTKIAKTPQTTPGLKYLM
jgi:hypothetical protein